MVKAGKPTTRFIELNDGRTIAIDDQPMPGGGWVSTHEDVTERRQAEMKIAHMARHDALTGLPNRVLLRERLNEALAHVPRGQRLAVHYLDLDLFKNVNDPLGHPAGDELLRMVAERLRCCVRDTDTVCRVGGDEFIIIQADIGDITDAEHLARRIAEAVKTPYALHSQQVVIDVSIGVAIGPADGTVRPAPQECRHGYVRRQGRRSRSLPVLQSKMDARMRERRTLELALRNAFDNGEFELQYQPILNLDTGGVQCCEALLRWHHPERGLVPPAEFVPIAEEVGLIIPLGEWVIGRHARMRRSGPATHASRSISRRRG